MKRILIIEDDPAIQFGLTETLNEEHFEVITAEDGEVGYQKALSENLDLIILDLVLPSKNGIEICKELRKKEVGTPILMLTGKKEEVDIVIGLEVGADDYVTKPFSIKELMARIKALLRREAKIKADLEDYTFGNITLDFIKLEARKNNILIDLSTTEYKILEHFIQHEGEVVSRYQLLDEVWGYESFPSTRTVDNFILNLRKKIEENPSEPNYLLTIHKAGYKFMKGKEK